MTVIDDVAVPTARQRVRTVVRLGLVVMWVVWAALAWWSSPREAGSAQLDADLGAGRIVSYATADSWEYTRLWAAPAQAHESFHGRILIWATKSGQTFYTAPSPPVRDVERRLELSGVPHRSGISTLAQAASILALVLMVVGLGYLLAAPPPALGTRWFWFWIGQLPLGVGYLAWLWWERPWTTAAPQAVRRNGWWGFGLLFLAGLAWFALASGTRHLFGAWLIPGL